MKAYVHATSAISAQGTFNPDMYLADWRTITTPYFDAQEPDYQQHLDMKQARRMSRVVRMGASSALQALETAKVAMPGAIVVGTGLGCSTDTEKFLADMVQANEGVLSPTAFIQSTHNTIAGQIALLLKCVNYNFTYTNRGHSFENALQDALLLIAEGESDILLGGIDEATPMVYQAFLEMGCVGEHVADTKMPVLGEGASFFVLSAKSEGSLARVDGSAIFGRISAIELNEKLELFLAKNGLIPSDIDTLMLGYNNDESDRYYTVLRSHFSDDIPVIGFKKISGEYFTAMAFALHLAVKTLEAGSYFAKTIIAGNTEKRPSSILIYNHYEAFNHSFTLVSR